MKTTMEKPWYISRMHPKMEKFVLNHSVAEIIEFIKEHGTIEEDDDEITPLYRNGKFLHCKTYMLGKECYGNEFMISDTGRLFYVISVNTNLEITDCVK